MMRVKTTRHLLLLLILMVSLFGACTKKTNPTGNNWSDTHPLSFTDSLFTLGFSFGDTVKVSGYEGTLLAGNMDGAEAITFLRFTGLPADSLISTVTDASLELTIKRRNTEARNPLTLSFVRLKWHWTADSTFAVADTSLVPAGIADFVVPVIPAMSDSTVSVPLPADLIKNWYHAGSNGLSIAIKTDAGGFAEFYSIDSGTKGPQIKFKYKLTTDAASAAMKEYESYSISDSYRVVAPASGVEAGRWILNNISPSRIFAKFALNPSRFVDMEGVALDEIGLKRLTINKAELVFYVKDNPYYTSPNSYSFRAMNVVRDSINSAEQLYKADYEILALTSISSGTVSSDSIVINITPLVQGYTSGDLENLGVVIRSLHEIMNFGKLELWHFSDAPAGKKPYLRVRYTPPYL